MKEIFLFCRHGESKDNTKGDMCPVVNDSPLTEKGKRQELAFIDIFRERKVKKVYYSPKQRAKGIGPIVERELSISHETLQDLEERKWGTWGNLPWKKVSCKLEKLSLEKRYTIVPPKGESWLTFEERFLDAIEYIRKDMLKHKYDIVAIITHRGVLRAGLPILTEEGKSKHKEFSMELGSATIISYKDGKYHLKEKNIVPKIA